MMTLRANQDEDSSGVEAAALSHPGPIEAALRMAIDGLEDLSKGGLLDEETLTASLMGGIRVAIPAAAKLYGSGIEDQERRCSWGAYKKSARSMDEDGEAASGADFALVLWESSEHARVAIFQAKKRQPDAPIDKINVNRSPGALSNRRPQLVMLAGTGLRSLAAKKIADEKTQDHRAMDQDPLLARSLILDALANRETFIEFLDRSSPKSRFKALRDLNFINYLVYRNGEPCCIPFTQLSQAVIDQEFAAGGRQVNYVDVDQNAIPFRKIVERGLALIGQEGWLRLDKVTLEAILPDLQSLMAVHTVDGRGGGLDSKPDVQLEVAAGVSSEQQISDLNASLLTPRARKPGW